MIIKERPGVTIPAPSLGVEVERDRVERREVETTGQGGCDTKTVRKECPERSRLLPRNRTSHVGSSGAF